MSKPAKCRARVVSLLAAAAAFAAVALAQGCGGECRVILSEGLVIGCGEIPPGPDDPALGGAAQVLVEDAASGARLWIGLADADEVACVQRLREESIPFWIGGEVVIATNRPLGFFFAPAGTFVTLENEDRRTTIAAIEADPEIFTAEGGDGGFWIVPANVLAVEATAVGGECPIMETTAEKSELAGAA